MKNSDMPTAQKDSIGKSTEAFLPSWMESKPAGEDELKRYFKELQSYLIGGEKTSKSLGQKVRPVWLASELKLDNQNIEYPVCYDAMQHKFTPLYQVLKRVLDKYIDEESLVIIYKELPDFFQTLSNNGVRVSESLTMEELAHKLAEELRRLDLPIKDAEDFDLRIENIQDDLLIQDRLIFPFSGKVTFELLNIELKQRSNLNLEFLNIIKKVSRGLQELKLLEGQALDSSTRRLDFASDLISFDKIDEIAVDSVSSHLSKSRLDRLTFALKTLSKAKEVYSQNVTKIMVSNQLAEWFDLADIFKGIATNIISDNLCREANVQSQIEVKQFVETIAALRIGELMIEQKYDEDLHDIYFNDFDLNHLTDDDLKYFLPIIVIEESRHLMRQSHDFLGLLSDNRFVKILGINQLNDLFDLENPADPNYLDLASLAIFRRNSYVFQGGIDQPSNLKASFRKGLDFPGSALWNVLLPFPEKERANTTNLSQVAAMKSRFFPGMEFVPNESALLSNQVRLDANPTPEASLVSFHQQIKVEKGIESRVYPITIVDFLALNPKLREMLELIPSAYQSANFIPIEEYLSLPSDQLPGKVPIIWMVNDQNKLLQASIPITWIQKCRNRLDYWKFLQSLAGINNTHLQTMVEELKSTWEEGKKQEIETLKIKISEQFEKEKTSILEKGLVKMLNGLLSQENGLESVLTEISQREFQPALEVKNDQKPSVEEVALKEEKVEDTKLIMEEAWVESEECTSCKDCVDALPSVFKYNEDRQAYVHNPKGGAFTEIVKAAEKCPARCIHPGLPQNKAEKVMSKWIERAAKFN